MDRTTRVHRQQRGKCWGLLILNWKRQSTLLKGSTIPTRSYNARWGSVGENLEIKGFNFCEKPRIQHTNRRSLSWPMPGLLLLRTFRRQQNLLLIVNRLLVGYRSVETQLAGLLEQFANDKVVETTKIHKLRLCFLIRCPSKMLSEITLAFRSPNTITISSLSSLVWTIFNFSSKASIIAQCPKS